MSVVRKLQERIEQHGLRGGAKQIVLDASTHLVEPNREILNMRLDLSNPKAHPKKKEKYDLTLGPFDHKSIDDVVSMLRSSEPWRIDQVTERLERNYTGFVAREHDAVVGYIFYMSGAAGRQPHSDMLWTGIEIEPDEIYSFDSFVPPELRGRGMTLCRASYLALHRDGHRTAYGYVYATNKAARFSYKVMGWKEYERYFEHRIAGKLVVVNGALYKLNRFDRTHLVDVPFAPRPQPV